ncbi:unnamed protein product [Ambrosiozyma monospora]|uniref:Unnamed protein product n=1 Tax=Ambrosiozyma monospora TaxID=43982 RepID=A0A9W6YNQ6_AMBMO|nr:unnamed protein product [Ambrosiozyma monospora]
MNNLDSSCYPSKNVINAFNKKFSEISDNAFDFMKFKLVMNGLPLELTLLVFEYSFLLDFCDLTDHVPSLGQDANWDSVLIRCISHHTLTNSFMGMFDRRVFRFVRCNNKGFNMTQSACQKLFEGLIKRKLKILSVSNTDFIKIA